MEFKSRTDTMLEERALGSMNEVIAQLSQAIECIDRDSFLGDGTKSIIIDILNEAYKYSLMGLDSILVSTKQLKVSHLEREDDK